VPYAGLVLDVDSTLTTVEGIEWLAERRAPAVSQRVAEMTHKAMAGTVGLDDVYAERLALVQPSSRDVAALADAYMSGVLPGARDTLQVLRTRGIEMTVVSGGIRQAIVPLAASLGISDDRVHAVSLEFAPDGRYAGFDTSSPLARRWGKPTLVRGLRLARPLMALGDGNTDAELKTQVIDGRRAVDAFAAFVGVAARAAVVAVADYIIHRFVELPPIVLGEGEATA
jgi:phosphoserine phosphatase